jgi:hypothetical protein
MRFSWRENLLEKVIHFGLGNSARFGFFDERLQKL